jgi:hypothetical protein
MNESIPLRYFCNPMKRILSLLLFCTLGIFKSNAQKITYELKCDCDQKVCDTVSVSYFNREEQLVKKVRRDFPPTTIYYFYNSSGKLYKKTSFDENGKLKKFNKVYYQPNQEWFADSLFNADSSFSMALMRIKDTMPNGWIVYWSFKGDSIPSVEQRIVMDSLGNEFLNTTCYSPNDCITYKSYFRDHVKTNTEVWVIKSDKPVPELKEMEEYVLDENGQHKVKIHSDTNGKCLDHTFYIHLSSKK